MGRSRRRAGTSLPGRIRRAVGLLLSREVAVLTNAIAFNFLLCLFPLLLVLVAAAQRAAPGGGAASAVQLAARGADPLRRRHDRRLAAADDAAGPRPRAAVAGARSSGARPASSCPSRWCSNRVWGGREPRSFWKSRLLAFAAHRGRRRPRARSRSRSPSLARGFGREWPLLTGVRRRRRPRSLLTWTLFVIVYRLAPSARVTCGVGGDGRRCGPRCCGRLSKYAFVWNLGRMQLADALRPARLRGVAGAVGLRLEPRARVRRAP